MMAENATDFQPEDAKPEDSRPEDAQPFPLRPCTVTLSQVHLNSAPDFEEYLGLIITIPATQTEAPVHFGALVQETNTRSLMLESFYDTHVANKDFPSVGARHEDSYYEKDPLSKVGISHCVFQNAMALMNGENDPNDRTSPNFKVSGVSNVPFFLEGCFFSQSFFLLDHIFAKQEREFQFVAVLGLDFLRDNFVRARWVSPGYELKLPPVTSTPLDELVIYTSGCCLGTGPSGTVGQAGYGIHFDNLPLDNPTDWDMGSPLSHREKHTKQRAELIAVIRALQILHIRRIMCGKIRILTDSNYVVEGLNELSPNWRSGSKKRGVANADLFQRLERFASFFVDMDVAISLHHVPREENRIAGALSKASAASTAGGPNFKVPSPDGSEEVFVKTDDRPMLVLSRETYNETQPMIQWTPDGVHWPHYRTPPESSPTQIL